MSPDPKKTYIWSNGVSSIYVIGPVATVREMAVSYKLKGLQDHVNVLIDAKKRGTKNRM
jgi:hypothetical protein